MPTLAVVTLALLIGSPGWGAGEAKPDEVPAAAQDTKFSSAQLEQLVAPIALYPDGLAVQILMAATYPLEIVEAARWRKKNASLNGDALDKALESQDWDPSVESLTHFPDVLQRMSDNLDWTKDLGDAFLGQKDEVLDTVQRMRAKAYDSGALKTTKEQVVTREVVKEKEVIRVEPADPQVVYVPQYSPEAVYGAPPAAYPTPYYPAMYGYPPGYVATASLLSFGAGMAVGAAVWGDCDWGSHDVSNNYYGGGRLEARIEDGRKIWKLSPMDLESYSRWYDYSRARDEMFEATDTAWAPWYVVKSDDKRRARLNLITHLLSNIPYKKVRRGDVKLPKRQKAHGYREPDYPFKFIPEKF